MNLDDKMPPPLPDLNLVFIEGDTFRMGTPARDERPDHDVTVPSFYLAKYPVTQRLWQAVMGENPSYFQGGSRPVETVSWEDAQAFIEKLNAHPAAQAYLQTLNPPGGKFRLPSEAEWEFAARGGIDSNGYKYAGSNKLKEVGWYHENRHGETKPVGLKFPNELGLYDMSGNVREWCEDVWHENYEGAPDDGSAWVKGGEQNFRVVRGGFLFFFDYLCRVSSRYYADADVRNYELGFRLAR